MRPTVKDRSGLRKWARVARRASKRGKCAAGTGSGRRHKPARRGVCSKLPSTAPSFTMRNVKRRSQICAEENTAKMRHLVHVDGGRSYTTGKGEKNVFFLSERQASCNEQIQHFPLAIDTDSWCYLKWGPTDTRCIATLVAFIILSNGLSNNSVLTEAMGMVFAKDRGSRCMIWLPPTYGATARPLPIG